MKMRLQRVSNQGGGRKEHPWVRAALERVVLTSYCPPPPIDLCRWQRSFRSAPTASLTSKGPWMGWCLNWCSMGNKLTKTKGS